MVLNTAQRLVNKLWRFCDVLRDDGLSYPDYVEQLTYLLFLKMAQERRDDFFALVVPDDMGWNSLVSKRGAELHFQYARILKSLAKRPGMLGLIFRGAENKIKDPRKLQKLVVDLIDRDWWSALDVDVKGEAYEGLLHKTSEDSKSGAGQYFTPRALIDAIVTVVRPQLGETICDPACGTGGFLISSHKFILSRNRELKSKDQKFLQLHTCRGMELVDSVARLAAMNLMLHGIGPSSSKGPDPIEVRDSLGSIPKRAFDVVLTNPPFGRKSAISITLDREGALDSTNIRPDFVAPSNNKQVNFIQHVISLLKPGGRAAVIVPDNVLFESGAAETVRRYLLNHCDLHTILRLPTGIFYAQGVKASVLFFDRVPPARSAVDVWTYDLRSQRKHSLRNNPLSPEDLADFVESYTTDRHDRGRHRNGRAKRWNSLSRRELLSTSSARLDLEWKAKTPAIGRLSAKELGTQIEHDLREALKSIRIVTRWL
jgi:type I restriction enzyme M protein